VNSPECTLAKVTGPNRYWVAATPGNWNSTANWSDESGGPGGSSVPGSGNVAIFDGNGAGACAINAAVDVLGINITAGYDGTITQGAFNITAGSTGWTQAGGTFNGGSNPIAINGPVALSGGTFKSTSGTLTHIAATWTSNTGTPTFNANGGKVTFYRAIYNTVTVASGNIHFNDVDISVEASTGMSVTGSMYVDGTLTIVDRQNGNRSLSSGTIQLAGNLVMNNDEGDITSNGVIPTGKIRMIGTGNQTISAVANARVLPHIEVDKASGTLVLSGTILTANWTWLNGTLDATGSTLVVYPQYNTPITVTPGTVAYNNVSIRVSGPATVTVSGTWDVNGNLELNIRDNIGLCKINTGTFNVAGNLTATRGDQAWDASTCAIVMDGTGTISASTGLPCASLTVNTSGTISLAANLSHSSLTWTSGALNLSTYTLTLSGAATIATGATTLGVTVAGVSPSNGRLTCSSTVSGITNVGLAVTVTATEAQVLGQTYTILINNTALGAQFESVTWLGSWKGVVDYTANSGKNVTLSGIYKEQGSVFRFR